MPGVFLILGQTNNSPPHRQWEKQLVVGLLAANDCCIAFDAWYLNGKSHRDVFYCEHRRGKCVSQIWPGPRLTTATWRCRRNFSQWECSFRWKLRCHWLEFLRQRQVDSVVVGCRLISTTACDQDAFCSSCAYHVWIKNVIHWTSLHST